MQVDEGQRAEPTEPEQTNVQCMTFDPDLDISLMQKPWLVDGKVAGLNSQQSKFE